MSAEQQNVDPQVSEASIRTDDANKTLAEEVHENEYAMYQRTQQHMQEIEEEVRKTQALCGEKENIDHLVALYDPQTSPKYYQKASELATKYSHFRRIRGDGNCFYRAVLTALLEKCIGDQVLLDKVQRTIKGWKSKLFAFGFPELTTADFCEAMETLIDSIKDGLKTVDILHDDLNNENIANYYICFMRLITSGYLRENEVIYSDFIEGLRNMDQYCKDEVEPMWKEVDHICIIALVNAIGVPVRIEYMDQSLAPNGSYFYDVPEDQEPILFFLYRPGHYDIVYKKP